MVQLGAEGRRDAPPTLIEVERFIVGDAPSGIFPGYAGAIAIVRDGAFVFVEARERWRAWVGNDERLFVFENGAWTPLALRETDRLGIGASADDTNWLAVASPTALFTHAGDHSRLTINKAATADTGSVVFQTGFTGRAEIGLAGSDDLVLKPPRMGHREATASAWRRIPSR